MLLLEHLSEVCGRCAAHLCSRTFRYQEETLLWCYVMWSNRWRWHVDETCGGMKLWVLVRSQRQRDSTLSPRQLTLTSGPSSQSWTAEEAAANRCIHSASFKKSCCQSLSSETSHTCWMWSSAIGWCHSLHPNSRWPRGFVLALVSSTCHHTASYGRHLDWHSAEELTTHPEICQMVVLMATLHLLATASSEAWALWS